MNFTPALVILLSALALLQGGPAAFTWRTRDQKDFAPENSAAFELPASAEWREVKTELPVKGRLMHLRITSAKECAGLEIQSITLAPPEGVATAFDFGKSTRAP